MNKLKLFGTVGIIGSCIVGYFVGRHAGLKRCDEMLKHAEEAVMHADVIEKIYEDMDPKNIKNYQIGFIKTEN